MNLMESLISEMNRVRELIKLYDDLTEGVGGFGSALMRSIITRTEKSITDDDVVEMVRCFKELKDCEG